MLLSELGITWHLILNFLLGGIRMSSVCWGLIVKVSLFIRLFSWQVMLFKLLIELHFLVCCCSFLVIFMIIPSRLFHPRDRLSYCCLLLINVRVRLIWIVWLFISKLALRTSLFFWHFSTIDEQLAFTFCLHCEIAVYAFSSHLEFSLKD